MLAALTAALLLAVGAGSGYDPNPRGLYWCYTLSWALFAAAVVALRGVPARRAAALVLAGGVVVAATGLIAAPRTSTDSYRYAWDGRVQAAGISPYDHAPADPALAGLRDSWLFPPPGACGKPDLSPLPDDGCTRINRPQVHTIYPPASELYFLLVHAVAPAHARHKAFQVGGAVLAVATTVALLLILRRSGDPRAAAYWAWCPAVPMDAVNNAHVDVLGVLPAVVALGLTYRHRVAGGTVLGLAVAAKLLPALLLPGALSGVRRVRDAAGTVAAAAAVVAALYLPYLLVSHSSVLGYLGGYAHEEGYQDAGGNNRYVLLRLVLPDSWALPAAVVAMAAVVVQVIRRGDPERPWSGALVVTGTAFLLLTPGYSWYALLLVALVALDGRWEWLGTAAAGAVACLSRDTYPSAATGAYAIAAVAVLAGLAVRGRERNPGRRIGPLLAGSS
ncbi:glycosyltransferase 87 family protein [Streptomyces sp. NBC_01198]|nr:glycosyltransferase 87 family protein [Streptomyces sp. NBC_01198]